jgi:transcriptional regulator with GAF, ATPase, and Fis domain
LLQKHSQPDLEITDYHQAIKETKRQLVLKVLGQANGNYLNAARLLGIHPNNLHRLIRELNLKPQLKKQSEKAGS